MEQTKARYTCMMYWKVAVVHQHSHFHFLDHTLMLAGTKLEVGYNWRHLGKLSFGHCQSYSQHEELQVMHSTDVVTVLVRD